MDLSQSYILVSIIALAIIAISLVSRKKKTQKNSFLSGIASLLIIFGIILGENQLMSYSLFGLGIIIAFIDILKKY